MTKKLSIIFRNNIFFLYKLNSNSIHFSWPQKRQLNLLYYRNLQIRKEIEGCHDVLLKSCPLSAGKSSLHMNREARPKCIVRGSILEMKSTSVLLPAWIVVICVRDLYWQLEFGVKLAPILFLPFFSPVVLFCFFGFFFPNIIDKTTACWSIFFPLSLFWKVWVHGANTFELLLFLRKWWISIE